MNSGEIVWKSLIQLKNDRFQGEIRRTILYKDANLSGGEEDKLLFAAE